MCGIIAIKGNKATEKVLKSLKRLEYRGYDSCGVALKENGEILTIKRVGYVENLYIRDINRIDCRLAIGHTRWATHGGVSERNSHPHSSKSGDFVIVHNGILENYLDLKSKYLSDIKFLSDTDSEVIAQLIEYNYKGNVYNAFKESVKALIGSYAIAMINKYDDKIYFAKKSSPMVIGKSSRDFAIASDVNGIGNMSEVLYLKDNSIGYIDNDITLYEGEKLIDNLNFDVRAIKESHIEKSGFEHYMIKEIYEIPEALKKCYKEFVNRNFYLPSKIDNILMIGCGTSYHSSLMGKKYIECIANIKVDCEIASEYLYNHNVKKENTLGIFISQSGETADTLSALRKAKNDGMYTLAITNVEGSSITQIADEVLYLNAGAEICVASTKAYTSQVFVLLLLANVLKNIKEINYEIKNNISHVMPSKTYNYLIITEQEFEDLYNLDIFSLDNVINSVVEFLKEKQEIYLIGKNYDYISAMEGALKIKEVSYVFTDAYPCGELKHGTLALIDNKSVVISIMTDEILLSKVENAVSEIKSRGGSVIAISQANLDNSKYKFIIQLPQVNELLQPIISIIPLDILAYKLSISKGINPDKPRNLAKSVTVE